MCVCVCVSVSVCVCVCQQALTEFSSLCDQEPPEAVTSVLNIWSLMYNKLSTVSYQAALNPLCM